MSNADDRCAYRYKGGSGCNYVAADHDVATNRMLRQEPTHAFVEPAPHPAQSLTHPPVRCGRCVERGFGRCDHDTSAQPAPSGDEATVREIARAEAESIATRWVPAHMTARQGMVDDIAASLVRYRALGADAGKADGAREVAKRLTLLCDQTDSSVDYHCGLRIAENEAYAIARRGSEGK